MITWINRRWSVDRRSPTVGPVYVIVSDLVKGGQWVLNAGQDVASVVGWYNLPCRTQQQALKSLRARPACAHVVERRIL